MRFSSPWLIGGALIIATGLLYATTVSAATVCEIDDEYVYEENGASILLRECVVEGGQSIWLWDIARQEDVDGATWPDTSLAFGQVIGGDDAGDDALDTAREWLEVNREFFDSGGQRGPLAQRVENFLLELEPQQMEGLKFVFAFEEEGIGDAWPLVEQLRTTTNDGDFLAIAGEMSEKLDQLSADQIAVLQADLLAEIGVIQGLALKGILQDAGVM